MARAFDEDRAKDLYENTTMKVLDMAKILGCNENALYVWANRNYDHEFRTRRKRDNYRKSKLGELNPMKGKFGEDHPNYKGRCSDGKGYVLVLKPSWFSGRSGSKHIFEHHKEYCIANKLTEIPGGYVVHHKDGNKVNNHPDNLELMSNAEHTKLHAKPYE